MYNHATHGLNRSFRVPSAILAMDEKGACLPEPLTSVTTPPEHLTLFINSFYTINLLTVLPQGRSEACWLSAHIKRIKKDNHYPRGDEAMKEWWGKKRHLTCEAVQAADFSQAAFQHLRHSRAESPPTIHHKTVATTTITS